jgi:membrane-bound serine protease (ClpP class)
MMILMRTLAASWLHVWSSRLILVLMAALLVGGWQASQARSANQSVSALSVRIQGSINPAQEDLLAKALETCRSQEHDLLLISLDTPGGLGKSMREMVKMILNSPCPVLTWVGPKGARAASAGVFLVAASSVASMSPQTSIGAASPVAMGGKDVPETMQQKIKNDFLSLIRGVAKAKGRNVDWYEKAIEEAVSITASEAVMLRVVDLMATSPQDLLVQAGSRGIPSPDGELRFQEDGFSLTEFQPGFRHSFLSWLLDPQIAYLLLLGGIAGLFFELSNPGAIFPGVFGGICLLLGLYAMAVLPTNVAGLLLILLALVLFILEIAVTSYGLLSIGGAISLFIGSMILFRFEYGFDALPVSLILPTVLGVTLLIGLGIVLVTRAQLKPKSTGSEAMLGLSGEVLSWKGGQGRIRVRGEIWKARTPGETELEPGSTVQVNDIDGLDLLVEPEWHNGDSN